MILFWCFLHVALVFGGLLLRREIRAALEGLRLFWFGVPVRVPARPACIPPGSSRRFPFTARPDPPFPGNNPAGAVSLRPL